MPQQCKQYILRKQELSKLSNIQNSKLFFICQTKNRLLRHQFSNPTKPSGSGGIFAGTGFLSDLEKCRIPTGDGAEIRYSPSLK